MRLGLEQYILDAELIVDYMTQHLDKLYPPLAEMVRGHRKVAWGLRWMWKMPVVSGWPIDAAQSAEIEFVKNKRTAG
jgi:hypothetical protein